MAFADHEYSSINFNINNENDVENLIENIKEGDELLIELVKSYPHIWDKKSHDHKDNGMIENSWLEIGSVMARPINEYQNRWKRLKQYYSKERQKQYEETKSGSKQTTRKSWPLFKCMNFIGEHIQGRRTFSNIKPKLITTLENVENEVLKQ